MSLSCIDNFVHFYCGIKILLDSDLFLIKYLRLLFIQLDCHSNSEKFVKDKLIFFIR